MTMLASLSQLAAMPGMPSEPTLRKLIEENPDFPVVNRGKNGQAYEIDAAAALKWLADRREREEAERRVHQENLNQMALDFMGADAASIKGNEGLTPRQIAEALDAEVQAIKLSMLRGELVRKAEIEAALGSFVIAIRQTFRTLGQRLSKRVEMGREVLIALDDLVDSDLSQIADKAVRLGADLPESE